MADQFTENRKIGSDKGKAYFKHAQQKTLVSTTVGTLVSTYSERRQELTHSVCRFL